MSLQILAVSQTATFLSPAGQAIGNSQSELSEETIMGAWKVRKFCKVSRSILKIPGFVQWGNSQCPHARCCKELFTRPAEDLDACYQASDNGLRCNRSHCIMGNKRHIPYRIPVSITSKMGPQESTVHRLSEFPSLILYDRTMS
jgi:hypothetical protein